MLNRLRRVLGAAPPDTQMSDAWLRAQRQASTRIEFHGPRITLPINKRANERGWTNRLRLRRPA